MDGNSDKGEGPMKSPEDNLKRTRFLLLQFNEVARELALAETTDDVIKIIRDAARRLSGADGVTVVLREGDKCCYVEEDAIAPLWKGRLFPLNSCISGWVMLNKQDVAIEDIYKDSRIPHEVYRDTFVKSMAMAPIRSEDPIGAIGVYWGRRHRATTGEKTLLTVLGNITASVFSAVEARESLRRSKETLRAAFDAVGDGILVLDVEKDRFVLANPAVCRSLGDSGEELLSLGPSDIHPPDDLEKVKRNIEKQVRGEITLAANTPVKRKDGSICIFDINAATLELNGRSHLLGVFRDMTDRMKIETDLHRLKSDLEQRVAEKTQELQERVADLERFREATIERELRIKELREEVKRLKGETGR